MIQFNKAAWGEFTMRKNFSNFERRSLLSDLNEINRKYNQILARPNVYLNDAKASLTVIIKKDALEKLQSIPIDTLSKLKMGFRVKTLKEYGINTYKDLFLLQTSRLERFNGISSEKAYQMKNVVKDVYSYYIKDAKLTLSIDTLDGAKKALIADLHEYMECKAFVEEKTKNINYTPFLENLKFYKNNSKFFTYFWISKSSKQKVNNAYDFLNSFKNNEGKFIWHLYEIVNSYSSTVAESIEDFQKNSIKYLNILEEINPGLFIGHDKKFGLSEDTYEQINKQEIFDEGLKCKLRNYQKLGVKFILKQKRVLLGDEMGLGKTIEAIASMVSLRNSGLNHFVVVCPASVLVNWQREIEKHSDLIPHIIHGGLMCKAIKSWKENGGVAIATYGSSGNIIRYAEEQNIDMLVVDEAHYIKNPNAQRTSVCKDLCRRSEYALFMTGTAIENNVEEMRNLISILKPDFTKSLPNEVLMNAPLFKQRVSNIYYRRKREDVLSELPELIESDEWCVPTKKDYDNYKESVLNKNYAGARQIAWLHKDLSNSSKARRLLEIVEEAQLENRKVVIFSFFLNTINTLKDYFGNKSFGPINGSLSSAKRQEIIDNFEKAPNGSILLSQIMAGGTGLNIQTANVVVICEPQFKPSTENQAISRSYRMGQTRNVLVFRLLCKDTVDETIRERLNKKQQIFDDFADQSIAAQHDFEINEKQFNSIMEEEYNKILKNN